MSNDTLRLLCLSDIHGRFSKFPVDRMPDADAVLVAGDLTNMGNAGRHPRHFQEVFDAAVWMEQLERRYQRVFYVLGNHDMQMSATSYDHLGPQVRGVDTYSDEVRTKMQRLDGHWITGINLSPCFNAPQLAKSWCNMTANPQLDREKMAQMPPADIVISHCPPQGTLDYAGKLWTGTSWQDQHIGSPGLRDYIHRLSPRLVVCGHVHESVGIEYIATDRGETCVVNTAQTATVVTIPQSGRVEAELVA